MGLTKEIDRLIVENAELKERHAKLGNLLKICILHLIDGDYFTVEELEQALKED